MYLTATVGWWACMVVEDTGAFGLPANPLLDHRPAGAVRRAVAHAARRRRRPDRDPRRGPRPALDRGDAVRSGARLTLVYASGGLVLALYAVWSVLGVLGVATGAGDARAGAGDRAGDRAVRVPRRAPAQPGGRARARSTSWSRGSAAAGERPARRARRRAARPVARARLLAARARRVGGRGAATRSTLPDAGTGRCTPVERDGRPIAMLLHDPSLAEEPRARAGGRRRGGAGAGERAADARSCARRVSGAAGLARADRGERRRGAAPDRARPARRRAAAARGARADACGSRAGASTRRGGGQELLDGAAQNLDDAIRELRELARGIHPAVLSDRGLGSALEALASAHAAADRDRRPCPHERLPAPVEAAAYFVVAEAITNVARYADATHAAVGSALRGRHAGRRGLRRRRRRRRPGNGSGLRGLSDRIAALDGRLEVTSPAGARDDRARVIPRRAKRCLVLEVGQVGATRRAGRARSR